MLMLDRDEKLGTDFSSNDDTKALYDSVQYFIRSNALSFLNFDFYGTIGSLLGERNVTLTDLYKWADMFQKMPYFKKIYLGGRTCVAVHAGYTEEPENIGENFDGIEDFYLYAREESYLLGAFPTE